MTEQLQQEYIITEEQAQRLELCHKDIATNGGENDAWCIMQEIRSHLAPAADVPKFNSEDLLLLANDEWKRREERRHIHDCVPWSIGFINGFLTDKKWAREYVDKLRRE